MRKQTARQAPALPGGCVFDDVPMLRLAQILQAHAKERHASRALTGHILSFQASLRTTPPALKPRVSQAFVCCS